MPTTYIREPKRYDVNGEQLTISQIAKRAGVTYMAIYQRLRRGMQGNDLLMAYDAPRYEVDGQLMTVYEIAETYHLKANTVRHRAWLGFRGADLIAKRLPHTSQKSRKETIQ